jgi:hypothetical protein
MSFTLDLKKATERIGEEAERVVRGSLYSLANAIVMGTPVGNPALWKNKNPPKGYIGGTLRGAWNASINTPDTTQKNSKDKSGQSTLGDISVTIDSLEMGTTFYLTNPQPYAIRVEQGWSNQRPQGMVGVALTQAQQILDKMAASS